MEFYISCRISVLDVFLEEKSFIFWGWSLMLQMYYSPQLPLMTQLYTGGDMILYLYSHNETVLVLAGY